jgi:RNA polymerase sigma-70 factor (ECF subfamily)
MRKQIYFEEIYKELQPKILRYVSQMVGSQEAEDITQEVFIKVSRSLSGFKGESRLSTWVYRIATNSALDRLRSPSRKDADKMLEPEDLEMIEDGDLWTEHQKAKPDEELVRKEMNACIREFIKKLPPDYKTVMILGELEGMKNKEIADILQVSLDTVKIRLHRARARLKKELEEGCSFYYDERSELACDRKVRSIKFKKSS